MLNRNLKYTLVQAGNHNPLIDQYDKPAVEIHVAHASDLLTGQLIGWSVAWLILSEMF